MDRSSSRCPLVINSPVSRFCGCYYAVLRGTEATTLRPALETPPGLRHPHSERIGPVSAGTPHLCMAPLFARPFQWMLHLVLNSYAWTYYQRGHVDDGG